ncbi:MAG TPA: C-GCAxxG-C-C family protein [Bacillota bacterium]|jgi:C_GCAxxG_C_C family probable redox protein|nr:C_GCAxxG_C_C family protein [Peptococcaceae bacterium]HPU35325.1 C-GCAxxG-C-C family protein [Bacillota bacterium]HPZ42810.1 C-GCAxxG-C-C family protein [Bacillota bacterium]HQD75313.1 C-GCAxxG-C-C family protein [Bacillota bacterium]HUM58095.1 C-GCAxxG-C-C family protein [Bacillota bacterium]
MPFDLMRMMELRRHGFRCSQIILALGLEAQGKENPDVVRTMTGLSGGIGFSGNVCGCLTAGVCLLGLYAGKGAPEEKEHENFSAMVDELLAWFKTEVTETYGGINCIDIIGEDLATRTPNPKCAQLIADTYQKVEEILSENDIDITGE